MYGRDSEFESLVEIRVFTTCYISFMYTKLYQVVELVAYLQVSFIYKVMLCIA